MPMKVKRHDGSNSEISNLDLQDFRDHIFHIVCDGVVPRSVFVPDSDHIPGVFSGLSRVYNLKKFFPLCMSSLFTLAVLGFVDRRLSRLIASKTRSDSYYSNIRKYNKYLMEAFRIFELSVFYKIVEMIANGTYIFCGAGVRQHLDSESSFISSIAKGIKEFDSVTAHNIFCVADFASSASLIYLYKKLGSSKRRILVDILIEMCVWVSRVFEKINYRARSFMSSDVSYMPYMGFEKSIMMALVSRHIEKFLSDSLVEKNKVPDGIYMLLSRGRYNTKILVDIRKDSNSVRTILDANSGCYRPDGLMVPILKFHRKQIDLDAAINVKLPDINEADPTCFVPLDDVFFDIPYEPLNKYELAVYSSKESSIISDLLKIRRKMDVAAARFTRALSIDLSDSLSTRNTDTTCDKHKEVISSEFIPILSCNHKTYSWDMRSKHRTLQDYLVNNYYQNNREYSGYNSDDNKNKIPVLVQLLGRSNIADLQIPSCGYLHVERRFIGKNKHSRILAFSPDSVREELSVITLGVKDIDLEKIGARSINLFTYIKSCLPCFGARYIKNIKDIDQLIVDNVLLIYPLFSSSDNTPYNCQVIKEASELEMEIRSLINCDEKRKNSDASYRVASGIMCVFGKYINSRRLDVAISADLLKSVSEFMTGKNCTMVLGCSLNLYTVMSLTTSEIVFRRYVFCQDDSSSYMDVAGSPSHKYLLSELLGIKADDTANYIKSHPDAKVISSSIHYTADFVELYIFDHDRNIAIRPALMGRA